jgi:hypothetical protein
MLCLQDESTIEAFSRDGLEVPVLALDISTTSNLKQFSVSPSSITNAEIEGTFFGVPNIVGGGVFVLWPRVQALQTLAGLQDSNEQATSLATHQEELPNTTGKCER